MVAAIEASLAQSGFKMSRDSVAGRQTVVARTARFGRGRLGGRLHVFVLVAVFKAGMGGREHLDRFLEEAGQYAATVKGGLASGAVAVAVAVTEAGEQDGGWASTVPGHPPAAGSSPAFPVLVDLAVPRVVCPPEPAYLRQLVDDHVVAYVRSV